MGDATAAPGDWRDWVRLGRPHFLVGGVAFNLLGAALATASGAEPTLLLFLLAQAVVTATQVGVHYGNELHDLAADRANATRTRFAGGSHVLLDGRLAPDVARRSSHAAFVLAAICAAGLYEAAHGWDLRLGWALAFVELAIVLLSFAYSAPPLRLHSRGLGELAAGLIVAVLVPLLLPLAAGPALGATQVGLLLPAGLQVTALVTVLSLPDRDGDAAAGKRTLAVRLGARGATRAVQALLLVAGLVSLLLVLPLRATPLAAGAMACLAVAIAVPVLAGLRRWDALALCAAGAVGVQWVATMAALLLQAS